MTPYQTAREVFALLKQQRVGHESIVSDTQKALAEWQIKNFGAATSEQLALGVAEESGELAHAVLKHSQGIRGMQDDEVFRAKAADAIADIAIYSMQLCTWLEIDFEEIVLATACAVMKRDWKANQENGGQCF